MKKVLALLLALMMLASIAVAEEELEYHYFRFAGNMSFAMGWIVEDMGYIADFQNYKQEEQSGEGWASWTAVGFPVGDYENVSVTFRGAVSELYSSDKCHSIDQCEYRFADSENADYDSVLNTLISVYAEPVHTEASGTQFETVENCYGTYISGLANANQDETVTCNHYAQWMFIDEGTDKPVLIDISEMLDANGDVSDVIVRYSIIPEETEDVATNGF